MTDLVTKLDLEAALDCVMLRMTLQFGVMLAGFVAALALLVKL